MSETQRQWCSVLAKLVAPTQAPKAAAAFVDMLPVLPDDDRLYSTDAALRIARGTRRTVVPAFVDLEKGLLAERSSLEIEAARARLPAALSDEQVRVIISAARWFDRGAPPALVAKMLENTGSGLVREAFDAVRPGWTELAPGRKQLATPRAEPAGTRA